MEKIKLSKGKLKEIIDNISDKTKMEFYYKKALDDKIEANSHAELVIFLVILVKYFYDELFVSKNINACFFFSLKEMNKNNKYWDFYELLRKTNLEIAYCLIKDEVIDNTLLIGFSEIQSLFLFMSNNYLSCLLICDNAIYCDSKNSLCNFLKASIIEICYINKISPEIKFALLNYQFELIKKCSVSEILFDKKIFNRVFKSISEKREKLSETERKLVLTEYFEEDILSNEQKFYLNNRLFLNPLNNYGKFLETTIEEMESLPIKEESKKCSTRLLKIINFVDTNYINIMRKKTLISEKCLQYTVIHIQFLIKLPSLLKKNLI